jgi:hypothetical protein
MISIEGSHPVFYGHLCSGARAIFAQPGRDNELIGELLRSEKAP